MSARKPAWVQRLDEREKSIMVRMSADFSDLHAKLSHVDDELCRVARAVVEAERNMDAIRQHAKDVDWAVVVLGGIAGALIIEAVLR